MCGKPHSTIKFIFSYLDKKFKSYKGHSDKKMSVPFPAEKRTDITADKKGTGPISGTFFSGANLHIISGSRNNSLQ